MFVMMFVMVFVVFRDRDEPPKPGSQKQASAEQNIPKKMSVEPVSSEIVDRLMTKFQNEVQIFYVFYQPGVVNEWKLVVNGNYYLDDNSIIAEYRDVKDSLKRKTWNGYASAMCIHLHNEGYINKADDKNHIIRIIDAGTLRRTDGHWRKASLGSCDCRTWEPFDKAKYD